MDHRQQNTFHGIPVMEIAKQTGLSYVSVWRHAHGRRTVSPEAAVLYETKAGIPRYVLRPDLWTPPTTNDNAGDPTHGRDKDEDGPGPDLDRIPF